MLFSRIPRTTRTTSPFRFLIFPPYDDAAAISPSMHSCRWFWGGHIFRQGDLRLSSGEALKKTNSVWVLSNFAPQGIHPGYSAPSPVMPAGKLYTTSTVLSSGNTPPKTVFCIDFVQFCAGPLFPNATPFYRTFRPGGPARRYWPTHQVALTAKMLSEVAPNMPDRSRRS